MTLDELVSKWAPSQASEKANAQPFLADLCAALGVPTPEPARDVGADDYVFEKRVHLPHETKATVGFIDLFKRGAFVLEAKQGSTATSLRLGTAKRDTAQWTQAMQDARGQALGYARVLSEPVPFLIVTDVGYCFDLYACFDGSNSFRPFPTPLESRIFLRDLPGKPALVQRLRTIFTEPHALDPSKQSIKVTREVAGYLANLAKSLEAKHPRETVARFLMRCLFTMFAEDVGLLPQKLFEQLLEKYWLPNPAAFPGGVEALWEEMDEGKANPLVGKLLKFNGGLFHDRTALPLTLEELITLKLACVCDWSQVEPAIFGTLVERALDPKERHALGAHFTPRAYVERLVRPTVEEPLRDEWRAVRAEVRKLLDKEVGTPKEAHEQNKKAAKKLEDFLHYLSTVRVLDPACGTGNFLYVTLDLMKALEAEVRALHASLGGGHTIPLGEVYSVTPQQFRGIELNPWAREIAEMVLWIGYLQWHYKTNGKVNPPEPVLRDYQNIECRDAVLEYDAKVPRLGPDGLPLWRWDGETMKPSLVTGKDVPDESARTQVFDYENPRKAKWPKVDYIVSNPPFIGNKRMRQALGDGYVEALRAAHDDVPEAVDFVMYWWNHAAEVVRNGKARRFGLITTNSITQVFSRNLVAAHLGAKKALSIRLAIPDHPWVDPAEGAAVRIAMTVGQAGGAPGRLLEVSSERLLEADGFIAVDLSERQGIIRPNLAIGAEIGNAGPLHSNERLSYMGVTLGGQGFIVEKGDSPVTTITDRLRPYVIGRDLMQSPQERTVIDLHGLAESDAMEAEPELMQRLLDRVKPERRLNPRASYREKWWLFAEQREGMRKALHGLPRYIATCRTAKQRVFLFVEGAALVESTVIAIALSGGFELGALSSIAHIAWSKAAGSWLGVGNDSRYNNTLVFEPFPFPSPDDLGRQRIATLAEALDAHRKARQAAHPNLTLTGMYNVLEKLRSGEELTDKDKAIHEKGLVSVLKKIHDDLDAAVLDAYDWPHDLTDEQLVERLVQLNAERAAEEARGFVRWLRPEFQAPSEQAQRKPKQVALAGTDDEEDPGEAAPVAGTKLPWPAELGERMLAVRGALRAGRSMTAREVAGCFAGGAKRERVEAIEEVLDGLRALGQAVAIKGEGQTRWAATGRA